MINIPCDFLLIMSAFSQVIQGGGSNGKPLRLKKCGDEFERCSLASTLLMAGRKVGGGP